MTDPNKLAIWNRLGDFLIHGKGSNPLMTVNATNTDDAGPDDDDDDDTDGDGDIRAARQATYKAARLSHDMKHPKAMRASVAALKAVNRGDSATAVMRHSKAADHHDQGAIEALQAGNMQGMRVQTKAAEAHRAAASLHRR